MFKFAKYLEYALLAVCLIVVILFYVQSSTGIFAISNLKTIMASTTMVDGLIWTTYALTFLAILLVIGLSIFGMIKNPKSLKKTGITLGIAVVVIAASFFTASGAEVAANVSVAPTFATLKMTDTLLNMCYILLAVTILAIVAGAVMNLVKKR